MDKKTFIKSMEELISIKRDVDGLNVALKKFDPDFNFIGFGRYEELVFNLLKLAMDDKYDYIGYWLYELDCGEKYKKGCIRDKNDKPIPLKTLSDLYNIL